MDIYRILRVVKANMVCLCIKDKLIYFSHRQIQTKVREITEDDPRIPDRFKKDQKECGIQGENVHMRDLLRQGKIPQRFLSEQMLENNFTQF